MSNNIIDVDKIKDNLRHHISEILNIEENTIKDDDDIVEEYGADSIVITELFVIFESEYNVDVEEINRDNVMTLNGMANELIRIMNK